MVIRVEMLGIEYLYSKKWAQQSKDAKNDKYQLQGIVCRGYY